MTISIFIWYWNLVLNRFQKKPYAAPLWIKYTPIGVVILSKKDRRDECQIIYYFRLDCFRSFFFFSFFHSFFFSQQRFPKVSIHYSQHNNPSRGQPPYARARGCSSFRLRGDAPFSRGAGRRTRELPREDPPSDAVCVDARWSAWIVFYPAAGYRALKNSGIRGSNCVRAARTLVRSIASNRSARDYFRRRTRARAARRITKSGTASAVRGPTGR